jgi:putative restriction endonuclease
MLLRSDLHKLFDGGYLTVDPNDLTVVVSRRIREEFENGHEYYRLHGATIRIPEDRAAAPSREFLTFHSEQVFRS